ncbi:MAG TPA: bifunctional precorrin-2 dehydrogenase/sirohydrochlorin ferrochelatase, partial [Terriglobales bacterium]|nr:bifunctional precorrin-2 dehydrogenase/sirohydrochlorin ferrochelatase [Terriglobales bacterium]
VLVVGGGAVGEAKIRGLLDTGAQIRVVALQANQAVHDWADGGIIALEERAFGPADLDGAFLVVAATSSPEVNELIFGEAQSRGILCNVVDVPELCDFFYPAVVRRGDLQIAISTAGQSPLLAQRIRKRLEQQFGPEYAEWLAHLGELRREVLSSDLPMDRKRELLRSLTSQDQFSFACGRTGSESEEEQ